MRSMQGMCGLAVLAVLALSCVHVGRAAAQEGAGVLPDGVKAVWDLDKAYRESTATRERVCINGLWRWQPAPELTETVPTDGWGYFEVPGSWPGITSYMQKDCQTLYPHPSWADQRLASVTAAWYQREITIPAEWAGRRISLYAEYVNSAAAVYLDGQKVGEIRFPAGDVDLTSVVRPGATHTLSMYFVALPLNAVVLSFSNTNAPRQVRGSVARRGLCGDVYLVGVPQGPRITDVTVRTSVRKGEITFVAGLDGLSPAGRYTLHAEVTDGSRRVGEFTSDSFGAGDLTDGQFAFTQAWKPEKLWDVDTPQNQYSVNLSLQGADGRLLDAALPERFGFREFWINGRDFYLNGTRIFLSAVPLDNAEVGAAWATYDAARESLARLKAFGTNFVYTHNYGCSPGDHLSFEEILRAADDVGMLVAVSQPHFRSYRWDDPDADRTNGYADLAKFYVGVAGSHPSVVFYATSHNTTGYSEDMNPDKIDGIGDPREGQEWAERPARQALRAQAIIEGLDPTRVVYHHSSGNLGTMHTINFYANWAPAQEMSDWFEHWATVGVKPLFTCEYAVPGSLDWTMFRGWYNGRRDFGSGVLPYEFCIAEWDAQSCGDQAEKISEAEKVNLRWEAAKFRAGELWHRWDYPNPPDSRAFDERYPIYAAYLADNWRAFRTLGVSGTNCWEYSMFWKPRPGVDRSRKDLPVDWDGLQRPGLSPDYIGSRYERIDMAFDRADWIPTAAGEALLRNNRPLLAYIGGKPDAFTSKDHDFYPGETVDKQLIVINNSREPVTCDCTWSFGVPSAPAGSKTVALPTGEQERIPLRFELPATLAPGRYDLKAAVRFSTGETQEDAFTIDVLARPAAVPAGGRIALFDPKGETSSLLEALGVRTAPVNADADLSAYDVLIVGKGALTPDGAAPDIARVRDGLKVVVFEQTGDVLEKRFGFRKAEYGLRQVFRRVPDHPILSGLTEEQLHDWRGSSTALPPRLDYEIAAPFNAPTVHWCDIPLPQVWRCGNRGDVASALIEKPAVGDFLSILDGGYSLQYSALMEYHEGRGMVIFCQADVCGRTESDPAAESLARNILRYVADWQPTTARAVVYAGDADGRKYLEATGIPLASYAGGRLSPDQVLVVGPGGAQQLAGSATEVADFLKAGGDLLAVGLSEQEANAFLPAKVGMTVAEHIATYFDPPARGSLFAGVSPADVHSREPRELPLLAAGATALGDGVLAKAQGVNVVFFQLAPWQFDVGKWNTKRTFRRTSCALGRLLANMGASAPTPILARFHTPVDTAAAEGRWSNGFYLDVPEEWDYPYRFFRW